MIVQEDESNDLPQCAAAFTLTLNGSSLPILGRLGTLSGTQRHSDIRGGKTANRVGTM